MIGPFFVLRRATLLLLAFPVALAAAETPSAPEPAHITVSGTGEVIAPAARASFTVGIETLGATAAAAGAEGARTTDAVTAALRRAGLPGGDIKSTHLIVNPQWTYDDKTHQRRRTGFQADSTLVIDTGTLDRLGVWLDAALGAGATTVSDPTFVPADDNALRRQALARAVQNARGDAQVMAQAAGGTLGALQELNTGTPLTAPVPMMRAMAFASSAAPQPTTNIVPGDIHISATVTGVWRYIAGPATPGQ